MDIQIGSDDLIAALKDLSSRSREARQLSKRLKELLPSRLSEVKNSLAARMPAGQATRYALEHPTYGAAVDEYLQIRLLSHESWVQYETHLMLFKARRSLNGWNRARQRVALRPGS